LEKKLKGAGMVGKGMFWGEKHSQKKKMSEWEGGEGKNKSQLQMLPRIKPSDKETEDPRKKSRKIKKY